MSFSTKLLNVFEYVRGHLFVEIPRAALSHQEQDLENVDHEPLALVVEEHSRLATIEADVGLQLLLGFNQQSDGMLFIEVKEDADCEPFFDERRLERVVGWQVLDFHGAILDLVMFAGIAWLKIEAIDMKSLKVK